MSGVGNGTVEAVRQIEKRLDKSDQFRHEMHADIGQIQTAQAVQGAQLDDVQESVSTLRSEIRDSFARIASSADEQSRRRFQLAIAALGGVAFPIVVFALTTLVSQGA